MTRLATLRPALTKFTSVLAALCALAMLVAAPARAQLELDLNVGNLDPIDIAIPAFLGDDPEAQKIGADLATVISNNLARSALFAPTNPDAFIERLESFDVQPRFQDWTLIGSQALLAGHADIDSTGRLTVSFRLWDLLSRQQLVGMRFRTTPDNWRRAAHQISDAVYQQITGESGYFDTRIVFIAEEGPKTDRRKRLAIMDQDGANPSFLTDGPYQVLTPRFSPTAQEITFVSYASVVPRVYLFNIQTGRREILADLPGMNFAPRFTPDGENIIFSLEQNGNSDIWSMDLRTRQRFQLTTNPAIDTSPSMAPDGRQMVFNSDRGGSPQLYVMDADGENARRISFGDGRYSTPVWSPRGDLIAFTKQKDRLFHVGVMRPDGTGERLLTDGYLVDGPTWSPNGRVIMFMRETRGEQGRSEIRSVDLTGRNEYRVPTPGDASDPAWSPLLD